MRECYVLHFPARVGEILQLRYSGDLGHRESDEELCILTVTNLSMVGDEALGNGEQNTKKFNQYNVHEGNDIWK